MQKLTTKLPFSPFHRSILPSKNRQSPSFITSYDTSIREIRDINSLRGIRGGRGKERDGVGRFMEEAFHSPR